MESETDELAELLLLAANEGELNFAESSKENTIQSTPSIDTSKNEIDKPFKPTEEPLDSSDEEDLQNFFERKYNEYGRDIKSMLKNKNDEKIDSIVSRDVDKSLRNSQTNQTFSKTGYTSAATKQLPCSVQHPKIENINIHTDPVFGIRIVQPLISGAMMKERMIGRIPVDVRSLQMHLERGDLTQDWCLSGVIVNKSPIQTSQKGAQYVIWKITDLKGDISTVSIFLFKNAYKELWKTAVGMVIAILNPSVFPKKDNKNETSLSVDNPLRVMVLGTSKDFGTCKSKKKNGDNCNAIVNLNICEYCVYHVKQEYGKLSGRSELQSATSGRGLQSLRNKVLGKNEVFYAGKSFAAEPAVKSKKLVAKDKQRMMALSDVYRPPATAHQSSSSITNSATGRATKIAEAIDISSSQRQKDLERLRLLKASGIQSPSNPVLTQPTFTKANLPSVDLNKAPSLSRESFSFTLTNSQSAKAKAAELLKKKPIEKSNPNFIKYRGTESGKKRVLETLGRDDANDESIQKKRKLEAEVEAFKNERIQKILQTKSSHTELIKAHELSVQDQYFNKLEKKEAMEEKMLNTKQVDCKAVICLQCKYKAFSAADRCKDEKHPLKVVDAEKRFYECEDCGNRTITLFRIPKISCSNCHGSRWKRAGMIRDKNTTKMGEQLSIRGDEETFLGGLTTKGGNVNLCVAES